MRKLALLLVFPLLLATGVIAHAATGTVDFFGGTYPDLKNPPTGQCIITAPPFPGPRGLDNYTNAKVTVYENNTCTAAENSWVVQPGKHFELSGTWYPIISIVAVKVG
ncbi:hypothetical protein ACFFS4_32155 [Kutzneria kofuensis]|uniref:Peptidase inhibitor family I36 n=1 Tax=Kutzneria kofuensis TaxID=103725 RepID=A0A7W9KSY1_9PSEU|nr:hypothetical protein [Kutzneria kofuensis]MBB5898105.1 hypothetical protein [Kutzneria kofuensis]